MTEQQLLPPYTDEEKAKALAAIGDVDWIIGKIGERQAELQSNYIQLGKALYHVQRNQYWMITGYHSWEHYLQSVSGQVRRTQLYHACGIARDLGPLLSEADLVEIGISKAAVLRKVLKTGRAISQDLIDAAKNEKLETLESKVAEITHEPDAEPGEWFDLGTIKLTKDELAEFVRAANLAVRTDPPVTDHSLKNWSDEKWPVRKEILWRWTAEYLAEHEANSFGSA